MPVSAADELFEIAAGLEKAGSILDDKDAMSGLDALGNAAESLIRSFSGSWIGYHSTVYYRELEPTPPGAHFSVEWGLGRGISTNRTVGEWEQFSPELVQKIVLDRAENPDLTDIKGQSSKARTLFDDNKSTALSIFQTELTTRLDPFLESLKDDLQETDWLSKQAVVQRLTHGQKITRDALAVGQGIRTPPHIEVMAEVASIKSAFNACRIASGICRKAGSHLERQAGRERANERIGTNVFIGHGRSLAWRELKDFVQDRLKLPWDEFNRVPVAGVTNIARLSEMLDAAAIAFLVMTAEDEMADGQMHARLNVVHEAGLFQGRLGFGRAILLLEEGCTEFSNVAGLGQIRFPKGTVSSIFEDIRLVCEREGLVEEKV